ncbi:hypothetical protein X728_32680 [Mesorhizobium sp. L103C120A0]|nr:hypothetical protein X728_32680 [Mesorhizobium sp. L103C120A0]
MERKTMAISREKKAPAKVLADEAARDFISHRRREAVLKDIVALADRLASKSRPPSAAASPPPMPFPARRAGERH